MARTKEQQIISQSTLKLVLDWGNTCGYCLELKDLVGISRVVEEYVENGYSKEMGQRLEKVDDYLKGKQNAKDL
jgi:thiol-disulfide isomerase/thioredoxin